MSEKLIEILKRPAFVQTMIWLFPGEEAALREICWKCKSSMTPETWRDKAALWAEEFQERLAADPVGQEIVRRVESRMENPVVGLPGGKRNNIHARLDEIEKRLDDLGAK